MSSNQVDTVSDDKREVQEMTALVIQQKKDHESDLHKRDELIEKLKNLFKEVEMKQAQQQNEHEQKIRAHMNSINQIRQKMQISEKQNGELKE
jgi:hypothetical protein